MYIYIDPLRGFTRLLPGVATLAKHKASAIHVSRSPFHHIAGFVIPLLRNAGEDNHDRSLHAHGHLSKLVNPNARRSFESRTTAVSPRSVIPSESPRTPRPADISLVNSLSERPVDIVDLELYNDFVLHTLHEAPFDSNFSSQELKRFTLLALSTHYLLYSILALSAIKLYLADRSRHELLLRASYLQSNAISLARPFYASPLSQEGSVSMIFFSGFAGHFSFAEGAVAATAERAASQCSPSLVKTLLNCFQLVRGIRTLLAPHWEYLKSSWIGPIFRASMQYGSEYEDANHFLSTAKEPETSHYRALRSLAFGVDDVNQRRALLLLIERTFCYLYAVRRADDSKLNTRVIQSWCIDVDPVLDDLFLQQKPITLLLMAYYAVLMNNSPREWWVSNWPELLMQHVDEQLGEEWDEFLNVVPGHYPKLSLAMLELASQDVNNVVMGLSFGKHQKIAITSGPGQSMPLVRLQLLFISMWTHKLQQRSRALALAHQKSVQQESQMQSLDISKNAVMISETNCSTLTASFVRASAVKMEECASKENSRCETSTPPRLRLSLDRLAKAQHELARLCSAQLVEWLTTSTSTKFFFASQQVSS
nr:hypothetical protein CFP56_28808 [Quercus suber]